MRDFIEQYGGELTGSQLYGIPNSNSDWDFDISVHDVNNRLSSLKALGFDIENKSKEDDYYYANDITLCASYKSVLNGTTYNLLVVNHCMMEARRYFRNFMLAQTKEFITNLYNLDKKDRKEFFSALILTSVRIMEKKNRIKNWRDIF